MNEFFSFLSGALMMGCFTAAGFFFRFKRKTGDALFGAFGVAFVIFGLERILILADGAREAETHPLVYLIRAIGFILILLGIVKKNRVRRSRTKV